MPRAYSDRRRHACAGFRHTEKKAKSVIISIRTPSRPGRDWSNRTTPSVIGFVCTPSLPGRDWSMRIRAHTKTHACATRAFLRLHPRCRCRRHFATMSLTHATCHYQEDLPSHAAHECGNCGHTGSNLACCARCRSMWFCSVKCQKAYWPFHKQWCRKNDFADAVERTEPKFARWMRKHGKQAVLKDGAMRCDAMWCVMRDARRRRRD